AVHVRKLLQGERRNEHGRSDLGAEHGCARIDVADVAEHARSQLPACERLDVLAQRRLVAGAAADVLPRVVVQLVASKRLVVGDGQGTVHGNSPASSLRSTSRSSAGRIASSCSALRGPTTTAVTSRCESTHASASTAGSPRLSNTSSASNTSSFRHDSYSSGRSVILEPTGNEAPRRY